MIEERNKKIKKRKQEINNKRGTVQYNTTRRAGKVDTWGYLLIVWE
jgi:hypothetical protein